MTRAALYLRQSLDVTEGIERQRERCTALVAARGWSVEREYADNDTSASRTRGPETAWGRMLADAQADRFDVVIAVDLDRLLRSTRDLVTLIDTGAKVVTIDGEIDLSTADGEFRATMLAGIARFEVRRKSERRVRGNEQRAARGVPTSGVRAFGWEPDNMTLRAPEAAVLQAAHEHVIAGGSLHSIASAWNEAGVRTSRGGTWSTSQIRDLLLRARNAGHLTYQGVVQANSQIEPAVSEEQHAAVVAIIKAPARRVQRGPKPGLSYLTGLLVCSTCDGVIRSHTRSVRTSGGDKRQYVCGSTTTPGRRDGRTHVTVAAGIAETFAEGAVLAALMGGRFDRVEDDTELRALVALRAERAAARDQVQSLAGVPGVDMARLVADLTALGTELESLDEKITQARASRAGDAVLLGAFREMAGELTGGDGITMEADTVDLMRTSLWHGYWTVTLSSEDRRTLVSALPTIVVGSGQGADKLSLRE